MVRSLDYRQRVLDHLPATAAMFYHDVISIPVRLMIRSLSYRQRVLDRLPATAAMFYHDVISIPVKFAHEELNIISAI